MVVHSKLRSWLTIIGIVIGVASVIGIVSMGDGMQKSMEDQMQSLESDIITLSPGFSRAMERGPGRWEGEGGETASDSVLDNKDIQILKSMNEILIFDTRISGNADLYFMGEEGSGSITGVDQKAWSEINTNELDSGRLLGPSDQNVIVIGDSLANDYFDEEIAINKILYIEGSAFRVVGILEQGTKNVIYMPIKSAYEVVEDSTKDEYDSIIIKVKDEVNLTAFTNELEEKLMISRHVDKEDKDFTISSNAQMAEMRTDMLSTMTTFLTAIAAISLIVGSVGIANTMFTSVLEKTKQIGIMKAIGARNGDILKIFLLNAALIGIIGGLVGLLFGFILAQIIAMAMSIEAVVSFSIIAIALGVSLGAGIIAGIVPAYQASQLDPVEALRRE